MSICRVGDDVRIDATSRCTSILRPEIVDGVTLEDDQEEVENAEQHYHTHHYPNRYCLSPFDTYSK